MLRYRRPPSDAGWLSVEDEAGGQKDSAKKSFFRNPFAIAIRPWR
jgi:hypothetical protein